MLIYVIGNILQSHFIILSLLRQIIIPNIGQVIMKVTDIQTGLPYIVQLVAPRKSEMSRERER